MPSSAEVVGAFQAAVGRGDVAAARGLLHDQFSFNGPFDTFTNPDDYLRALAGLAAIVQGVEPRALIDGGENVGLFYEMRTNVGVAPIAELHHVRDGRIDSIRAYFDARLFVPLMEARRAATT